MLEPWIIEQIRRREEEERRKWEWIVEREVGQLHERNLVMPWTRREADDRRFRKTLAMAALIALLFALIIPLIHIPLKKIDQVARVPDRVVKMMVEKKHVVPPREVQPKPEERVAQQKPEKVVPHAQVRPVKKDEVKPIEPPPQEETVAQKGILAFRDRLAAVKNTEVSANLGLQAHLNKADDNSPGAPQRSMLTTNGPGSSGGINLASLSRGLGGQKGGGAGLAGVQVTRASSAIGGNGTAADTGRPLASGARPTRTATSTSPRRARRSRAPRARIGPTCRSDWGSECSRKKESADEQENHLDAIDSAGFFVERVELRPLGFSLAPKVFHRGGDAGH